MKPYRQCLLVSIVLLLACVPNLLARAGGGEHFGSGGAGFGGAGGAGGIELDWLVYLMIRYPVLGLVVLIILLLLYVVRHQLQQNVRTQIVRHNLQRHHAARDTNLAALKERDPCFDEAAFQQRVRDAFVKIQHAWSNMNLQQIRPVVSDGVYERFTTQIGMMRSAGQRNVMSGIQVESIDIVAVTNDGQFDCLHLAIQATAIDYTIDLDTRQVLFGSKRTPQGFSEYWSFLRKPGTRTKESPGLLEGCCPNCGGHIEAVDTAVCRYCRSVLSAGEYDWVLAEITQEVVWDADRCVTAVPGVHAMRARDNDFNTQHIEDRASAMFWRTVAALKLGEIGRLGRGASDHFMTQQERGLETDEHGGETWFEGIAVGAVELQQIRQQDNFDYAEVLVRWSGLHQHVPRAQARLYHHVLVLKRSAAAQTAKQNLLASCHCPGCGAPDSASDDATCDYCGTPLNTGQFSWVLDAIRPERFRHTHTVSTVPRTYTGQPTLADKEVIACAAAVMYADGTADERERAQLARFAQARGLGSQELADIVAFVEENDGVAMPAKNENEAKELLDEMLVMCLADGIVDDAERTMLKVVAAKAQLTDYDINRLIKLKRAELYRAARNAKHNRP